MEPLLSLEAFSPKSKPDQLERLEVDGIAFNQIPFVKKFLLVG
jgi:hypothetical protein